MSAIAGIIRHDGVPGAADAIGAMSVALAHRGPDRAGAWIDADAALAHRMLFTTPESLRERQPAVHMESGVVITADARVDNREELAASLGVRTADGWSDADLILSAYLRWGTSCASALIGDFAFAIWDPRTAELFCARDHMGVKPFYYCRTPRLFAFASEIKALLALPEVDDALDDVQVARHLDWDADDRDRTLFRAIKRLPAAHTLVVAGRRITASRYWSLDDAAELRLASDGAYAEAFRATFTEAVRARLHSALPVGATLSGGLDSSSIVCTARRELARAGRAPVATFSLVFPSIGDAERRAIDERAYVDRIVTEGGVVPYQVAGDSGSPLAEMDRMLWHLDEPHFAPNLYLHWAMYRAASEAGIGVLLDGFDGDTAVSHGLGRLDALAATDQWDDFEREVRAFAANREISPAMVLPHYGLPYLDALARAGRWGAWRRAAGELARRFGVPRRTLVGRHGARAAVPETLRAVRRLLSAGRDSLVAEDLARRLAPERRARGRDAWRDPLRDERAAHRAGLDQAGYQLTLETADKCAAAFGIEARYPFFDRRVIELCVALPAEQKMAGGWTRLVLRRAMEGVLPPEIQWRATKSNLSPNFRQRFHAADRAEVERVDGAALAPYGDPARFDALRSAVFTNADRRVAHADELSLFRATMLAHFLATRRRPAPARFTASVAHAPSLPHDIPRATEKGRSPHLNPWADASATSRELAATAPAPAHVPTAPDAV